MDRRKRQHIILNGIDLAIQRLRREIETAGHRQAGIVQAVAHLLCKQQTVPAGRHDYKLRFNQTFVGKDSVVIGIFLDPPDLDAEPDINLFVGLQTRLIDKRLGQRLKIDRGIFILHPHTDHRLGTALHYRRLQPLYVIGLK